MSINSNQRCENKIDKYCENAIKYEKYAETRRCKKCCIECVEPCNNICHDALEIREKGVK